MFHHQLSIPLPAQTWFLFVSPQSEKADSVPRHPTSRPRACRCCPDQEGERCASHHRANGPLSFPEWKALLESKHRIACWGQRDLNPKKDSTALGSSGYQLSVPCKTFQCDQNCPFSVPILPWTLCSLTKSLFPKTWAPFSKTLVISQARSPGPIRVTGELPLLNSQTSPSKCPGNSYLQVTKSCVYFG